jgi:hypothetical protein
MWEFIGPHVHIMLVYIAVQMKMGLITKPYASRYCWTVLEKHLKVAKELHCPGSVTPMKGLLLLNLVQKQFHISNYPVCWWCSQVELLRKTFYRLPGTLCHCLPNTVNVFLCFNRLLTSNTLLIVSHTPSLSNLLTSLFIAKLLGAFLHSNLTQNSHWTVIRLAVW